MTELKFAECIGELFCDKSLVSYSKKVIETDEKDDDSEKGEHDWDRFQIVINDNELFEFAIHEMKFLIMRVN